MTREEAIIEFNIDKTIDEDIALINKIYDNFESRTCENCKYGHIEEDYLILCNADFYDNSIYDTADNLLDNALFYPSKDFGCNKFERK